MSEQLEFLSNAAREWREKVPVSYPARVLHSDAVNQCFIEGPDYCGKPTRFFAFWQLPEGASPEKPVPGVVLVHGGGATALADWVKLWNKRGFAAISMDTCGCVPGWSPNPRSNSNWPRHEYGIPVKWGDFEHAVSNEPQDQWVYHATAAAVISNSFLRSIPGVDADRVGITGVSWGGRITLWASSVDPRFAFAMSVYGTGFCTAPECRLGENFWGTPEFQRWQQLWEPEHYLDGIKMPCMLFGGTGDVAFPFNTQTLSAEKIGAETAMLMLVDFPHDHDNPDTIEEFTDFAKTICAGEKVPVLGMPEAEEEGSLTCAVCGNGRKIVEVQLLATRASGFWPDRKWNRYPAEITADGKSLTAKLPVGTTAAFFNVTDDRGSRWSSRTWGNLEAVKSDLNR